jgi:hypothetical protein
MRPVHLTTLSFVGFENHPQCVFRIRPKRIRPQGRGRRVALQPWAGVPYGRTRVQPSVSTLGEVNPIQESSLFDWY